jgi:predicted MFS family arabinose efflux permease
MDHGMSEVTAASLLATVGLFDIIGTIFSGWLTDRWNSRLLLCWYYALRGLSLFVLPFALRSLGVSLVIFIVFYGLDWVATVPPTAALTAEIFGPETGSVIYGGSSPPTSSALPLPPTAPEPSAPGWATISRRS